MVGIMLVGLGGGGLAGGASLDGTLPLADDGDALFALKVGPSSLLLGTLWISLLRAFGSGVRLLILVGGAGLGLEIFLSATPRGVAAAAVAVVEVVVMVVLFSAMAVATVKDDTFFGGGGRGMLGGGGIIRLAGLLTFFILALARGGGMGVEGGVSVWILPKAPLALGFSALTGSFGADSAALAVAAVFASSKAGGTGGGGRRRGLAAVIARRFGAAAVLEGVVIAAVGTLGGGGSAFASGVA